MDDRNRELLNEVINDRLTKVLNNSTETDEDKQVFKEAMDALSKQIELEKIETSHLEQIQKMTMEDDRDRRNESVKISEARKDRYVQIGIFGAGLLLSPFIERWLKMSYAKVLCEFEKDYNWTTSAGRALSNSLFRFKK